MSSLSMVAEAESHGHSGDAGAVQYVPPPITSSVVTFPLAARRNPSYLSTPLKLEAGEESDYSSENISKPQRNLWQVYALGGFLVTRWIWARWKERNERGDSPEE